MESSRAFLLGIIAGLGILSALLVLPYIQFVLAALLLAYVLHPLHRRLSAQIGDTASAVVLVIASLFAVVLPIIAIMAVIAQEAVLVAEGIGDARVDLNRIESILEGYVGEDVDLRERLGESIETAIEMTLGGVLTLVQTVTFLLIGIGLLLFLLFFFIRDGHRMVAWIRQVVPLPVRVTDDLGDRVRGIVDAVLVGHVLIAIIQGLVAGIGLFVVGIPNVAFWTFVMIILALIPLIGTFLVWAPASGYLYLTGDVFPAIGLFVYGVLVVSISDEYLRPIVIDRFANISASVIIVGVIGGISLLGFMGLFVGPMIVGAFKECVELYDERYGRSKTT